MRILCMGDSNTWGHNPADGMRIVNRWPKVLQEMMPEHEIIEEGLNGRTVISPDYQKPERCGMSALKMLLMTHQPLDLVILMLGTNEFKREFNGKADYIAGGIREYIKIIRNPYQWEKYPVPDILVISPVHLGDQIAQMRGPGGNFDADSLLQSRLLAGALAKVCDAYGAHFMDAADYAQASGIDGIHMDEENHRKLAAAVCEKIKEL